MAAKPVLLIHCVSCASHCPLILFVVLLACGGAGRGRHRAASVPDSVHYRRCLADSSANPALALADAESWTKSGGGVPAQHCAALALVSLKRYAEAGTRLDQIAGGRAALDVQFRIALYDQAGNAWLLAGEGAQAVQSFSGALALSAGDPDLFADHGARPGDVQELA